MFKKIPKIVKILTLLALVVSGGWYYRNKSKTEVKTEYATAQVEKGTLVSAITASGSVAATNSRTVTTTASGVVKKIYVTEGQKVSAGTPILQIELDLDGRQKFQSAYASYQGAQNNLVSAQNKILDLDSSLVSAKNIFVNQWANQSPDDPTYIQRHNAYLSAQAAYDQQANVIKQAQTALESARLAYQQAGSTVYAPISGTVSAISLTPGMILNPTSSANNSTNLENKIAIVKTNTTPAITVNLTEIDVTKVKYGNKATITLDAIPNKTFTGKVIAVDTAGTSSSGVTTYPTTIQFDEDVPEVMSKMSANASIITAIKDNVLMVPTAAVKTQNGVGTVLVMKDGVTNTQTVETGLASDSQIEIVSGLNEGETVVTSSITNGGNNSNQSNTSSPFGGFGGRGMGGGGNVIRIQR